MPDLLPPNSCILFDTAGGQISSHKSCIDCALITCVPNEELLVLRQALTIQFQDVRLISC